MAQDMMKMNQALARLGHNAKAATRQVLLFTMVVQYNLTSEALEPVIEQYMNRGFSYEDAIEVIDLRLAGGEPIGQIFNRFFKHWQGADDDTATE